MYFSCLLYTSIRNANTAKHDTVDVPASKMKLAIADILLKEGYIAKYDVLEDGVFKTIRITLKYGADKNEKIITGLKRISKPGLRIYAGSQEIPRVLGGLGIAILSTNQGVITDKEARKPVSYTHLFGDKREALVNKPMKGHFDKAGVSCKRFVREFKLEGEYTLGQEIKADIFAAGDKIDATAISKGKGFQGAIKRHGQSRGCLLYTSRCV